MAGLSHAAAADVLRQAWVRVWGRQPTDLELLYAQSIAWLENRYGRAGQFATFADAGHYNWGSLHYKASPPCPEGSVEGVDQGPVCFTSFPNDVDAAAAFVHVLTKQHWPVIQAMTGSPEDVAAAMRVKPPYYTGTASTEQGKIGAYADAIRSGIRAIGSKVPIPSGKQAAAGAGGLLVVAALAGGAIWWLRRR